MITVQYQALAWIEHEGDVRIGPWGIEVSGKVWRVALKPPNTLMTAEWQNVAVKLGGLDAAMISPEPSSHRNGNVVWEKPQNLELGVEVDPPWQRYFTWTNTWERLSQVGVLSWWLSASVVLAVAAVRALPQKSSEAPEPGGASLSPRRLFRRIRRPINEGPKQAVLYWAVLSAAVVLTLILLMKRIESTSWRALLGLVAGLALVLVARPWCRPELPSKAETKIKDGVRCRQGRAVKVAATVVAGLGGLAVASLHLLFGEGVPTIADVQRSDRLWLLLLGLATVWLGLAAMTAWAWRFAREGGLIRQSWIKVWGEAPVLWVLVASVLQATVASVILSCFWWAQRRDWKRIAWPGESAGVRDQEFTRFLGELPTDGLRWVYAYSWVLAGIALVALLRIRVVQERAKGEDQQWETLRPEKADFLLTAAIFAFMVGLRQVEFAGSNSLWALWALLITSSLWVLVKVGQRWSVLHKADSQFHRQVFGGRRRELLDKAHEYRNWHHELYLIEHGREAGDRDDLEEKLRRQGEWLKQQSSNTPDERYSVVDIALAWGPESSWWANAHHAAKLAFFFGIPASVALVWVSSVPDYRNWLLVLHEHNGLLEIAAKLLAWQIAWAGAGLVLGALWRVLPGRHSPVRALSLTLSYALPVGVAALLSRITDTEPGFALLHVLLMLTVLTLTSLWMDMATFRGERQFKPTNFSLLLSVYQMRGTSAQIAYVLAQLVAAVAIWRQVAGSGGG